MDIDHLRRMYDFPVFPCPRCGERSLALRESSPRAAFQCFECEAVYHAPRPFPAEPGPGPFPIGSSRRPEESIATLDPGDRSMASELFPADFEEKRLRRRHFRERTLRLGCLILAAGGVLSLLLLLIRFVTAVL